MLDLRQKKKRKEKIKNGVLQKKKKKEFYLKRNYKIECFECIAKNILQASLLIFF